MKDAYKNVVFGRGHYFSPNVLVCGELLHPDTQGVTTRSPDFFLIHFVCEGQGWVTGGGQSRQALKRSDAFLCFPQQEIQYGANSKDPWRYRWVGFQGGGIRAYLEKIGLTQERTHLSGLKMDVLEPCLDELMTQMLLDTPTSHLKVAQLSIEILGIITQACEADGTRAVLPARPQNLTIERQVEVAKQFMLRHVSDGIQVDDVIRFMGYERSYFSKVFSKHGGQSIKDHLNDLRFIKAEQLLLETNASIQSIASCLGAEDSRALNRLFKQRTGKTPLQFRKQS